MAYPSRTIAFQAAGMITSIVENLLAHDQIKYTPAFMCVSKPAALDITDLRSVYSLFSALIMHVYQMRSSVPSVVAASQERINVCMNALKEVSKVWLVARMVHTLFESILGNKVLEERLQKATGRKVQRNKHGNPSQFTNGHPTTAQAPSQPQGATNKRKFDDIDLGFSVGPPAPQMSYERSRPQTPAVTPSRELNQQQASMPMGSPPLPNDNLLHNPPRVSSRLHSRGPTRANSPFNGYSIPATPPDLFLVTRDEPNISQQLWENFQPDQLFPDGTIGESNMFGSPNMQHTVDPQLQVPNAGLPDQMMGSSGGAWPGGLQGMMGVDGMGRNADSDRWSNSSMGNAPIAPTHLNVEDWFQFFGINGEMNTMADPTTTTGQ